MKLNLKKRVKLTSYETYLLCTLLEQCMNEYQEEYEESVTTCENEEDLYDIEKEFNYTMLKAQILYNKLMKLKKKI